MSSGKRAAPCCWCSLSLTGIVWISLALRELNVVTGQGQSALTLIKMTTLGLPSFVAVITPFALLITAIHTLNRLNSDSEIIVLTASGATAWTITKPLVGARFDALWGSSRSSTTMPCRGASGCCGTSWWRCARISSPR